MPCRKPGSIASRSFPSSIPKRSRAWPTPTTSCSASRGSRVSPLDGKRTVGTLRERWPELDIALHLHDTRGMAIANAYAGLEMGVTRFDSSVAGLGGCPFAGHQGAAGNVCTEDLVFLCDELGIKTGIDLDALIDCARLAEDIVGHPLPGSVMKGGTLERFRSSAFD